MGALRIIQGHLEIRGDWDKLKYEGAYKISWEFEKNRGARLSGGLLQRGVQAGVLLWVTQYVVSINNSTKGGPAQF